jgi:hypothetical protein
MVMEQSSKAVATHSAFAHLVADHQGTAAGCIALAAELRSKQCSITLDLAKHHPLPVVTALRTV